MNQKLIAAGGILFALTGCGHRSELVGRPNLSIVSQANMPPPDSRDLLLQQRSYAIGPLDRVIVDVYGAPDLSRSVQVDAGGNMAMPLIGMINAAGKTAPQIAAEVSERLRGRYVRNPNVTVTVDTFNQMVTVDGQVAQPGLYPVSGRMTLIRAISSAHGLTQDADVNFIVVFRQVGGKYYAAQYDIEGIREGRFADPELFANDVVTIGQTTSRQLFQTLVQAGALLTGPAIAILQ
jgi:polysaccharide export outer membrane protein